MNEDHDEKQASALAGIVGVAALAALAGAVAALLLAPKSGRETRAGIKRKVDAAKAKGEQAASDARRKVQNQIRRGREEYEEAVEAEVEREERRGFWGRR